METISFMSLIGLFFGLIGFITFIMLAWTVGSIKDYTRRIHDILNEIKNQQGKQ